MEESNIADQISFPEQGNQAVLSLTNWMTAFVVFYFFITIVYFGIAAYLFFNGFRDFGIQPKGWYSLPPILIGIVSQYLARELYISMKNFKNILNPAKFKRENMGKAVKRLKNYFFVGALFLIVFIITFLLAILFALIHT